MARAPAVVSLEKVERALRDLLGGVGLQLRSQGTLDGVDLVLRGGGVTFAVEWKAMGDAANVGSAVRQLSRLGREQGRGKAVVPLVAVPFMGETGRQLCAEAGLSWIDLSGNASIDAPGRQIRILGHRNRFASVGRPANVFAPVSSRVMRVLLMEPGRALTQSELVSRSEVDKGRVSRLVRRLETMGLVERVDNAIRLKDPRLALDAWREAYDFDQNEVWRGHIAVRTPEEFSRRLGELSSSTGIPCALTGLAAAWQRTHFAMFRLTTVYVRRHPPFVWMKEFSFREDPRGANLWLVRPLDDAVFWGAERVDGVPCVHPVQVYLDLKAHPERAQEAAEEVRRRFLDRKAS
jgi:hypothetical protein